MHENVLIEKNETESLEEIEKHHIEKILKQTNGKSMVPMELPQYSVSNPAPFKAK